MPGLVRRFSLLSGLALCAILGGPIAIAQASDNTIRSTINHYGPIICSHVNAQNVCTKGEEATILHALEGYPGSRTQLVRALSREIATLRTMKRKLLSESASSAAGSKGKKEVVKGLTLIANAYSALRTDVKVADGGPVPAAKVTALQRTDRRGQRTLKAGLNLLSG